VRHPQKVHTDIFLERSKSAVVNLSNSSKNNAKTVNKLVFPTWENAGVGYQAHQVDFFRAQVFEEKCDFRGVGAEAPPPPCALVSAIYS